MSPGHTHMKIASHLQKKQHISFSKTVFHGELPPHMSSPYQHPLLVDTLAEKSLTSKLGEGIERVPHQPASLHINRGRSSIASGFILQSARMAYRCQKRRKHGYRNRGLILSFPCWLLMSSRRHQSIPGSIPFPISLPFL